MSEVGAVAAVQARFEVLVALIEAAPVAPIGFFASQTSDSAVSWWEIQAVFPGALELYGQRSKWQRRVRTSKGTAFTLLLLPWDHTIWSADATRNEPAEKAAMMAAGDTLARRFEVPFAYASRDQDVFDVAPFSDW